MLSAITVMAGALLVPGMFSRDEARQKARYYYMKGHLKDMEEKSDEAYSFYRRAVESDSTFTPARFALGGMSLSIRSDSMRKENLDGALAMMKSFVDEFSDNDSEASYYAYITSYLGHPLEAVDIYSRQLAMHPERSDILLNLARAYETADSADAVLRCLNLYEVYEGKSSNISSAKAKVLISKGDTVAGLEELRSLVSSNPKVPENLLALADFYDYLEKRDSALTYYKKTLEADPGNPTSQLGMATTYSAMGDSVASDNAMYDLLMNERLDADKKVYLLMSMFMNDVMNGKFSPRFLHLMAYLRDQYPHDPLILEWSARLAAANKDFAKAAEEMSFAIDVKPEEMTYYEMLAAFQLQMDKPSEALATFERAQSHGTAEESFIRLKSFALSQIKEYDKAIEALDDIARLKVPCVSLKDSVLDRGCLANVSVEKADSLSELYGSAADIYKMAGDSVMAFRTYENALVLNPDNSFALNNYAYELTLIKRDLEKAEKMAARAVELAGDNVNNLDTYAWVLYTRGKYKEAEEIQKKAVEVAGSSEEENGSELYDHYGDILFMNGKQEEAVAAWEKALKITPDNETIRKKVKNRTLISN